MSGVSDPDPGDSNQCSADPCGSLTLGLEYIYLVSYKVQIPFFNFRDVSKLLEQGQGEPKTAGLGAGTGGVHAGQQLEETAEKTPPETAAGEKACCRCQAAAEKEAETIDCLIFIFLYFWL